MAGNTLGFKMISRWPQGATKSPPGALGTKLARSAALGIYLRMCCTVGAEPPSAFRRL
jgi:hypothetical protein